MGNSDPLILPHCTYQTTNIEDNGIANALKHFHLI
jgi:hydrolase